MTAQEDCTAKILMQSLNGLNRLFFYVEAFEDLPQACMTDSEKRLLEVYEVLEQIALVL